MDNPFDQFDAASPAASASANPFDQFDAAKAPEPAHRPYLDTLVRQTANAIPGMADIAAAGDTATSYLPKSIKSYIPGINQADQSNEPFTQRFSENLARQRSIDQEDETQYPVTSFVAPIVGAVASLPVAGPTDALSAGITSVAPRVSGLAADALASGAVGSIYGGAYGLGSANKISDIPGDVESGALWGGVGGAAAPVVAKGLGQIGEAGAKLVGGLKNPESAATQRIAEAVNSDQALNSPRLNPSDFADAQAARQPVVTADIGGNQTRDLARTAANVSPDAGAALSNVINPRFEDQGPRVADFLKNIFGNNLDAQGARDALTAKAKSINGPAYRQAYADGANGVWTPELQQMVNSPAVQDAIKGATKTAANDAVLNKTTPIKNPFVPDAQGNMTLKTNPDGSQAVPTLQFWDYVKRGLDDQASSAFRSGEKSAGGQLVNLKNQLLGHLDEAVPTYATARQGAFQMFGADNALEAGENFLKIAPTAQTAQMKAALAQMTPVQKQIFSQGLASQMAQSALNAPMRRNVIGMFNSPEISDRLQLALGPQVAPQVEAFLRRESVMDMLRTAVQGNSTTAKQTSNIEKAGHGIVGMASSALSSPIAGAGAGLVGAYHEEGLDPESLAIGAAGGALTGLVGSRLKGANAAMWKSVGEQLTSSDPAKINAAVARIGKNPAMLNALRATEKGLTYLSASRGVGQTGQTQQQQPQMVPAYAVGGRVEVAEPTEAQKAVGNYKKGHIRIHGLDVTVENPKGSYREGIHDGKPWRVKIPHHYGYIRGTIGADDDHVDCYVGPHENSDKVFIVDQKNLKTNDFDEHKVMLGFKNREGAIGGYCNGFSDGNGYKRIGKITPMSVDEFKQWVRDGDTRKPLAKSA